jgi:aspartyl-tRNA(Asn)/glutamyl-tRNA(Gln) amidotransferase subunit B
MEEDAGKSVHDRFPGATAVDLNRAGVPLIEIVSEPDMRSANDADAYLKTLKQILEYVDVSDLSMEEGSLRVDANISVRVHGARELGTKTEVKNMNSFTGVVRALEAEFERQCAIVDAGGTVEQQTMLWDGHTNEVRPARSKEGSHDYRYFPEPDLPPLVITDERIDRARGRMPELPSARRARYAVQHAGLTEYDIDVLTSSQSLGVYFERVASISGDAKTSANWVLGEVLAMLKDTNADISSCSVRPEDIAELIALVRGDVVSHSAAKQIFAIIAAKGGAPRVVAEREGLLKVSDESALSRWIDDVLTEHPEEAARFIGGEKRLQGVLVGYVMKKSKGSADPKRVNQLLVTRAGA